MERYVQYMYSYPHKTAYRPLDGVFLADYVKYLAGAGHGLYVHIPFCQAKCGYCNLFSVTGQGEREVDKYLDTVSRQAAQYQKLLAAAGTEFSEIVIGGGTPLYLTLGQLGRLFGILDKFFRFSPGREITIETAPGQTDKEKVWLLKQAGVTRVSMGIQSFHDSELAALGRGHRAKKARRALGILKQAGFPCINLDFIYGIPGQTEASLLSSLKEAIEWGPDEIFLYPLYIKHGVGLERTGIRADADEAYRQYQSASQFLRSQGFLQDSMRRFVRREGEREFCECGFGTSLAIGCGGRSYLGNLHFCSPYAVGHDECMERLFEYENTKDFTQVKHGMLLSQDELKRRYAIRHLFIRPGLMPARYEECFGSRAEEDFPVIGSWIKEGLIRMDGDYLTLTEAGFGLSDCMGPKLMSGTVRAAMEGWEERYGYAGSSLPRQPEKLQL